MNDHDSWSRRRTTTDTYNAQRRAIELGQAIYDARTAKGWSQRRLAEEAHVRQATISSLEAADVLHPTLETLDKLASALDLDVNVSLTSRPLTEA
ncbi:MAG: helix-turn-helix transcriptional regulator [Catenulisporales bacterium]|jgi:transcriptional regulator with XRE-family HTH domain|nr:helix-turn-helix transcriptional regulator [Catenulisporales bacterium]